MHWQQQFKQGALKLNTPMTRQCVKYSGQYFSRIHELGSIKDSHMQRI
jgi:hypothetical protein